MDEEVRVLVDTKVLDRLVSGELDQALSTVVQKAGQDLKADVRNSMVGPSPSPPGHPPAVVTGNLKNSITMTMPDQFTAQVGTHVEYAGYLEYGTNRMAARPFLRPGLERIKKPFERAVRAALRRLVP